MSSPLSSEGSKEALISDGSTEERKATEGYSDNDGYDGGYGNNYGKKQKDGDYGYGEGHGGYGGYSGYCSGFMYCTLVSSNAQAPMVLGKWKNTQRPPWRNGVPSNRRLNSGRRHLLQPSSSTLAAIVAARKREALAK